MYKLSQCNSITSKCEKELYCNLPMIFCSLHKLSFTYHPTHTHTYKCCVCVDMWERLCVYVYIVVEECIYLDKVECMYSYRCHSQSSPWKIRVYTV